MYRKKGMVLRERLQWETIRGFERKNDNLWSHRIAQGPSFGYIPEAEGGASALI